MKLIQFDFAYDGPFGQDMAEAMDGLARSIPDEPGFIWKIGTENQADRKAGGIYLFADEASASAYIANYTARLKEFGIENVNAKLFDMNRPLTEITKGPV